MGARTVLQIERIRPAIRHFVNAAVVVLPAGGANLALRWYDVEQ